MNNHFTFYVRVACRSTERALFVGLVLLLTRSAPGQILFESDYGSGTINCFTSGGAPSPFATGLASTGLAFDNGGNLFAGDGGDGGPGNGRILRFTPDGSSTIFASGLWAPFGVAFNSHGVLFADDYNNNIYEYTPQGVRTIFASGLSGPTGLAFDASGNLFVAEWDNGNIDRFTPGGVQSTFASGFTRASGLAFNGAGDLFVVDAGIPAFHDSGALYKITPGGLSTMVASGMFAPTSLAFDTEGDVYVTDTWNGRILEFSPDGTESTFASGLNLPTYLAFQSIPEPSAVILLPVGSTTLFLLRRTHHGQKVCARTSNGRPNFSVERMAAGARRHRSTRRWCPPASARAEICPAARKRRARNFLLAALRRFANKPARMNPVHCGDDLNQVEHGQP